MAQEVVLTLTYKEQSVYSVFVDQRSPGDNGRVAFISFRPYPNSNAKARQYDNGALLREVSVGTDMGGMAS